MPFACDRCAVDDQHPELVGYAQHTQDGWLQLPHHQIAGGFQYRGMKAAICHEHCGDIAFARLHGIGRIEYHLDLARRCTLRSKRSHCRLQDAAQLRCFGKHSGHTFMCRIMPGDHIGIEQVPFLQGAHSGSIASGGSYQAFSGQDLFQIFWWTALY